MAPILVKRMGADGKTPEPHIYEVVGNHRAHVTPATFSLLVDVTGRRLSTPEKMRFVQVLPRDHEVWSYPVIAPAGKPGAHEHTAEVVSKVVLK